jgi:hypothetical protein
MPLKKITTGIKKTEGGGLRKLDMGALAKRGAIEPRVQCSIFFQFQLL